MSPEREIVEKFKETVEMRNTDIIAPYVAEDTTVEILPSTFVVVPPVGTSEILSVMMQGWDEADRGSVDQQDGRKAHSRRCHEGQDLVVDLMLPGTNDSSSSISSMSSSTPRSSLSRQVNLILRNFTRGLIRTTVVGKNHTHPPIWPTRFRYDVPLPPY